MSDGTRIRVNANVVPMRNAQGEIIGAINCWRDITAQKQMEATLKKREADLSLVTNAVPVLISFIDRDQRYRFNNRTYEAWFDRPAEAVYGKTLWEVLGDSAYAIIRPYVERVLAGEPVTFEREVHYQRGGIRYIQATYIPRFEGQELKGFVAMVSDISDRKRAEAALRQSGEQLLSLHRVPVDLVSTIQSAIETVRLTAEAKAIDLQFTVHRNDDLLRTGWGAGHLRGLGPRSAASFKADRHRCAD